MHESMTKFLLSDIEKEWASEKMIKMDEHDGGLNAIFDVNTENVKPLVTVLEIKNVLREDIAQKNFSREEILSNAPEQHDGYFQVPKTVG